MLGYCLTGETFEHVLFFLYGLGANGKSVLTKAVEGILKDYGRPAPMEAFVASKYERHTTDIAGLQGARFVTAAETDKGRPWAEARIKLLTGGDRVTARKMRRDNVDFQPQFKLVITGNHRPRLSSHDEAICRRILCVPFDVTIPPHERDEKLPERLRAEWSGILSWMIDGCLEWQRGGLVPTSAVVSATEEYLEAEDSFGNWIAELTEPDPNSFTRTPDLYASWREFAETAREQVGSMKDFAEIAEGRGFQHKHTKAGNGYLGIRLKAKCK
jgi:putative DNA primase/helicase